MRELALCGRSRGRLLLGEELILVRIRTPNFNRDDDMKRRRREFMAIPTSGKGRARRAAVRSTISDILKEERDKRVEYRGGIDTVLSKD